MAWTMDTTLATRRELGIQQLLGIGKQLDSEGLPAGDVRSARARAMCYAVEYGRAQGVHYDGGDWASFIAFVNPL